MKLKRVLYGVAAVAAAVTVAGYAMISSLDVQQVADFAKAKVMSLTGRELTIGGPVELEISLNPSVNLQDLRFANATWGSQPDMARIRRLEIEVALLPLLTGQVVVERLVAVDPDLLLEIDAQGRSNWTFDEGDGAAAASAPKPATAEEQAPVTLPDVQELRVEGGRLTLVDATTGETLKLDVVEAVGTAPSLSGARTLRLKAAYNGNPFTVDGSFAGLAALLSEAPAPLDLTIGAGGAVMSVKGTAGQMASAARAEVAVTVAGDSLAGLAPFVGSDLPPLGPYKLSTDLNLGGDVLALTGIVLQIGGSDIAGNVEVTLTKPRPTVKASLVSKLFDLADFSGGAPVAGEQATGNGAGGTSSDDGRLFSDEPLPLAALQLIDGQAKLTVDRLQVTPALGLDDLSVSLALNGGSLTAAPLVAQLAGGTLDGRLAVVGVGTLPEVALTLQGSDIDFGELLKHAEVSDDVGGKLKLDIDIKGQGVSPHALASALGGSVQAVSQQGTIDNALLRVLGAGLGDITGPLFGQTASARLECFVAAFDITEGQAASRALVLDAGTFAVAGRGSIDLAAERLNLAFDTKTSQPSLASLAIPFRVTGPLSNPSVTPDPLGAAAGVVGAAGDIAKAGGNLAADTVNAVGGLIGSGPLIGKIGDDQTLCGQALAALDQGAAPAATPAPSGTSSTSGVVKSVGDAVKGVGSDIEKGVKSLFGN